MHAMKEWFYAISSTMKELYSIKTFLHRRHNVYNRQNVSLDPRARSLDPQARSLDPQARSLDPRARTPVPLARPAHVPRSRDMEIPRYIFM
jgi:hypothetical protein